MSGFCGQRTRVATVNSSFGVPVIDCPRSGGGGGGGGDGEWVLGGGGGRGHALYRATTSVSIGHVLASDIIASMEPVQIHLPGSLKTMSDQYSDLRRIVQALPWDVRAFVSNYIIIASNSNPFVCHVLLQRAIFLEWKVSVTAIITLHL